MIPPEADPPDSFDMPTAGYHGSEEVPLGKGERIGAYLILNEIGEGGMGTVFVAEQKEPVQRRVALKLIKLGMDSKAVLARFEQERQALAMMNHDAIAKVLDGGTTERGQPWFAMELVEGLPITDYCDQHRLSVKDRVLLFQQVCAGVQHAHQKGVIHRDLKPHNILVARRGDQDVAKIIDFGIARATDQQLNEQTAFTAQGQLLGTPEYMSPEQAAGDLPAIDTRTDVYALGVILYELLSGQLPFPGNELRAAGLLEIQRILQQVEPPRPSTRLTSMGAAAGATAGNRRTSTGDLTRRLKGDLDWVILMAMAKEPERRYASPDALSQDLERYLELQPVLAGPPSVGYRLGKYWARNKLAISAVVAVLVAILVGTGLAVASAREANRQAEIAQGKERERAEEAARANANEQDARTAQQLAEQRAGALAQEQARFSQVSAVQRLRDLQAEMQTFRPASPEDWPEVAERIDPWLGRAEELIQDVELVEAALEDLRSSVSTGPPYRFTDPSEQFLHDTLGAALPELRRFASQFVPEARIRRDWGQAIVRLSVEQHATRWAEARDAIRKADGVVASEVYSAQHSEYHPIDLQPQVGLIPIGMNPTTKLWEFVHLRSAWSPQNSKTGDDNQVALAAEIPLPSFQPQAGAKPIPPSSEVPTDWIDVVEYAGVPDAPESLHGCGTGIVFVLIPGGTFRKGSPASDANRRDDEVQHDVTLAPYFLAKHELSQGQWMRLHGQRDIHAGTDLESAGTSPSQYGAGFRVAGMDAAVNATHPVESISWRMAAEVLALAGLALPTDSQWERGCRGGTKTTYWTGDAPLTLGPDASGLAAANILDQRAVRVFSGEPLPVDDGFIIHGPVDVLRANPFGLHNVHGNVWELCQDIYGSGPLHPKTGEVLVTPEGGEEGIRRARRSNRGCCYVYGPHLARSAMRHQNSPTFQDRSLGMRAARALR